MQARAALVGDLEICCEQGFCCSNKFDSNLVQYDSRYNNTVPSPVFDLYYDQLADYLVQRYDLSSGPVVDIGCGAGTFLKRMAERYEFDGIGIDPAYQGGDRVNGLRFISAEFDSRYVKDKPSLVLCRHVVEHIPNARSFLKSIFQEFPGEGQFPFFCEVPDLDWIIEQKSWWDFCYEHINYFTQASLGRMLEEVGCRDLKISTGFGGQYLWAEGLVKGDSPPSGGGAEPPAKLVDMNHYVDEVIERTARAAVGRRLVIWGMATKGVLYSLHARQRGLDVFGGVDINTDKQGKYAPVSGLYIYAPEDLPKELSYTVVCMNPNYLEEIHTSLTAMGLDFLLVDP